MNANQAERLMLKGGATPTVADLQTLDAQINKARRLPGGGIRRRILPWGTHEHYGGGGGGFVSPYFAPSVTAVPGGFDVSWRRGLIEGVEPTINGVPISSDKGPKFRIAQQVVAAGEALVYFRLSFAPDWFITKIEPFAAAETPPMAPYQADLLAMIVYKDGSNWRKIVANQGHVAINRTGAGMANHIFYARF